MSKQVEEYQIKTPAEHYTLQEIRTFDPKLRKYFSKKDLVDFIVKLQKKLDEIKRK